MSNGHQDMSTNGGKAVHDVPQYDALSKLFHWLTAAMVATTFLLGPGDFGRLIHAGIDPGSRQDIIWHESLGTGVFLITALRLIWIATRPTSPKHHIDPWMRRLSGFVHIALLTLLFALPITAILALISEGNPLTLIGGLRLTGSIWMTSLNWLKIADWGEIHKFLGDAIVWLAGMHALAALYHHFCLRDKVLPSMLPRVLQNFDWRK